MSLLMLIVLLLGIMEVGRVLMTYNLLTRAVRAGTLVIRTAQPLGTLAAFLLEPQSEDGLCTWNFFDSALVNGQDYPVLRLPRQVSLETER